MGDGKGEVYTGFEPLLVLRLLVRVAIGGKGFEGEVWVARSGELDIVRADDLKSTGISYFGFLEKKSGIFNRIEF